MTPNADLAAERVAQLFHEAYERLAPSHGYETREASAKPWADVPEQNKALMIATVGAVAGELVKLAQAPIADTGDLADIRTKWPGFCSVHDNLDVDLPCCCVKDDPRPLIAALVTEVETLRAEVARLERELTEAVGATDRAYDEVERHRAAAMALVAKTYRAERDRDQLHAEAVRLRAALDLAERAKAHELVDEFMADCRDLVLADRDALIVERDAMRPVVEAATAYVAAWHKLYRYPNQTPSSRPDLGDLADSQHATRNALIAAVDQMAPSGPLSVRQGDDRGAVAVTATDTVEAQGAAQGAAHACRCGGLDPIHGSSDA